VRKHTKSLTRAAALLCLGCTLLLLAAAGAGAAERTNYGALWQRLSGTEKELLLIGYARGIKSAQSVMYSAVWNEARDPEARRSLLAAAESLSGGLGSLQTLRDVARCLDGFYADRENGYIDWTSLVRLARLKLKGASAEQIEAELTRLRQGADDLEEIRKLHEAGERPAPGCDESAQPHSPEITE
jgi:hypothetical protein